MNDQHAQRVLEDALEGELSTSELVGASHGDIARALAARVFDEGWRWCPPAPPEVEEEWRVIPGFSNWEISSKGFIRHAKSHVWVPISSIMGEIQPIVLSDDYGRDVSLDYEQILDTTWPKPGTHILFANGNTAFVPESTFTGVTRKVEFVEEPADIDIQRRDGSVTHIPESELSAETVKTVRETVWKELPGLPSKAFQINRFGDIRIKINKRIIEKEPHGEVALKINGFYHYINGPAVAEELFRE